MRTIVISTYGGSRFKIRGLGNRQFKERLYTYHRIVTALSKEPYTFTQLWKKTRIHRNTLKIRINQLVSDRIIFKHKYSIQGKSGFHNRIFYLLNGAKKVSYIFKKEIRSDSISSEHTLNESLQKTNKTIESFVIEHSKRWISKKYDWQFDLFIYFKTLSLYSNSTPYTKVWEIMEKAGF